MPDPPSGETTVPGPPPRVVLASASPARLALLRGAGLDPIVAVSGVDETVPAGLATKETVLELARRKARAVAPGHPGAIVIGCDSLLDLYGEAIGKPGSAVAAVAVWQRIAGTVATLHTGQVVIDGRSGQETGDVVASTIHFATPSAREIARYVESGEPALVAGAFTIDGRGAAFVTRVEGDPNGVLGLSTALLRDQLRRLGLDLVSLWAAADD